MTADFILVEDSICDECLEELWKLDEKARQAYVSRRLEEQGLQDKGTKDSILEAIPRLLAQKRRMEELIERIEKGTGK